MLDGIFVTVVGFKGQPEPPTFSIGGRLVCMKEPGNARDDDAIRVIGQEGTIVGYLSNSPGTKAGGTLTASRVYDRVGRAFIVEVCFTTRTKVICRIIDPDVDVK